MSSWLSKAAYSETAFGKDAHLGDFDSQKYKTFVAPY